MVARKNSLGKKQANAPSIPAVATAQGADNSGHSIVGIGASAGGLEAFEHFFRSVPPECGMSFVLVPHLDPSHASILTEILQRSTTMPVVEAQDQVKVEPDHVYVIPPNRDMSVLHGTLLLSTPELPRGQRMPIDSFLRSLAEDQGERAIGIIFSGTGTDGTLGLRAIIGAGGISLVQDPATAKYDGMPSSAIQSGYATHVLPVEKMPELLAGGRTLIRLPEAPEAVASGLNRILLQLRSATGHDFTQYKKSTIGRRIERRMAMHDIDDREVYARYLKAHPPEVQALIRELLINVTNFFRDPEAFDALKQDILPQLFADKPDDYVFRVWVAGCASGEEAYSIAILLREYMDETNREFKVLLYATDLDDDAIATARAGLYPPNIAQDITPERLRRFFIKEDAGYRVKKNIREMVVFAVQNVIKDPPFTRLDLLCCRNLMIYLEPVIQNRLIPAFHYALKPDGVLFLSPSESIASHPELFTPINRKWKLYRAVGGMVTTRKMVHADLAWAREPHTKGAEEVVKKIRETNFAELTRQALLQTYAPASVVTDVKGNILYVHGDTGKYLRPAPGQATLNVIEMAREGLQLELRAAILLAASKEAAGEGTVCCGREVSIKTNGHFQRVYLDVRSLPLADNGEKILLVSFQDVNFPMAGQGSEEKLAPSLRPAAQGKRQSSKAAKSVSASGRVDELERELAYTRENLQATIEEQQASNEELKSTNEELQSTNEELQSTNEELETSKEELQSVNEELVTVNAELQAKIEQLAGMQSDMKNLLDNVNVGTVFLDEHLAIRRFTRDAAAVYRLIATDVGRPLADIKTDIEGDDLTVKAQAVLDTLAPWEGEVRTTGGAYYLARIQPYRTLENRISGVVLTFTDISQRVEAGVAVRNAKIFAENIINTVREPLIVLDAALHVVSASRAFYRFFQESQKHIMGRKFYELGDGQWDIPELRELLQNILRCDQNFEDFLVKSDFPGIGRRKLLLNARRVIGATNDTQLILLAMEEAKAGGEGADAVGET